MPLCERDQPGGVRRALNPYHMIL